jgi:hypothetical protein
VVRCRLLIASRLRPKRPEMVFFLFDLRHLGFEPQPTLAGGVP